ncbi:phage tail tube protein [Candidatus Nitrospira bockiana]
MPSNAIAAYGTLLKRGDGGSPESFTTVGEVKSISGPSTEVDSIDVTTHSSAAAGAYREFIPSLIDPGTVEFDLNYVPSDVTIHGMRNDMVNRTKRNFQVVLPGGIQTISFAGYVMSFPLEFPTDDVAQASVTIKITGAVTFS